MKKEDIVKIVSEKIGDYICDYDISDISVCTTVKNNGIQHIGVNIKPDNYDIAPCLYIDGYLPQQEKDYEYDEASIDFEHIARRMAKDFGYAMEDAKKFNINIFDKSEIEERLIATLVNYEENAERLVDCPFILFNDLAITFRWIASYKDNMGSILVNNQIAEGWGKTKEELFDISIKNTMIKFPPVIDKLDQVIKKMMKGRYEDTEDYDAIEEFPPSPFYIVSNTHGIFGATVILYDGILTEIYEKVGENYYILPSSINEVLIVPESFCDDCDSLGQMVKDVNDSVVEESEILSYSLYYYNKNTNNIKVVTA